MDTKQYIHIRTDPLQRVETAISTEENRTTVIDKLNLINNNKETPLNIHGIYTSTYPATFTIRQNENQREVEIWVKETRVGYDTPIPYLVLNEGKVMQTVIKDMFLKGRSPHFIYPITQIITNDAQETGAHICIYNLMEYFPVERYMDFSQYINNYNVTDRDSKFGLVTGVFQLFYNLAVMEGVKMRHNDLQLRNIKINPRQLFQATYVLDKIAYQVPSSGFLVFAGYERAIVNTDQYSSIPIPERYVPLKDGGSEDSWETWNPYADLATVWSALLNRMAKKTDMLDILFGTDPSILEDLKRLTQARNYQSVMELREEFKDDMGFLERCLPTQMARRFANQFFTPVDPKKVSGIVFSSN